MEGRQVWANKERMDLKSSRPVRVLVAEDDPELRVLVGIALRKDGYEVILAKDGIELADIMDSAQRRSGSVEPIDLLVSDVRMPGWTGLEVLAAIRETEWAFPVVLITAYGSLETLVEASRLGAAAVFAKPFDLDDLRTAVLNALPPARALHLSPHN